VFGSSSFLSDDASRNELEEFILAHRDKNPSQLRLKYLSDKRLTQYDRDKLEFFILQLEASSKFGKKISGLATLCYPSMIAGEQASNIRVSLFHASLVHDERSFIDLTAGLGIDFMIIARRINPEGNKCTAIEMDAVKADCLEANLLLNGFAGAAVVNTESIEYLRGTRRQNITYDLIYVDPARRSKSGGRIYDPADCSPDIITNRHLLLATGRRILIKNSPMLDITKCLELFPEAKDIYIVSYRNECKEILVDIDREAVPYDALQTSAKRIIAVDIREDSDIRQESFTSEEIRLKYTAGYVDPEELEEYEGTDSHECAEESADEDHHICPEGNEGSAHPEPAGISRQSSDSRNSQDSKKATLWLYEPSVAIMKTGAWRILAERYGLRKCSPNCHLFISERFRPEFPGRILRLNRVIRKKDIKSLKGEKRNVVVRNYQMKADQLAARLKVIPGSDRYIYGLTAGDKERPLLIEAIQSSPSGLIHN
ncbi:MAG: hypothetical protein K2K29_06000, partial [Muribaculaceae bacterium]|nr:hypothetical protein [Muribaculaceae bacterium]